MELYELGNPFTQYPNYISTDVKPINVGFTTCQYRIDGVKEDGTMFQSERKEVLRTDKYRRYNPNDQASSK